MLLVLLRGVQEDDVFPLNDADLLLGGRLGALLNIALLWRVAVGDAILVGGVSRCRAKVIQHYACGL